MIATRRAGKRRETRMALGASRRLNSTSWRRRESSRGMKMPKRYSIFSFRAVSRTFTSCSCSSSCLNVSVCLVFPLLIRVKRQGPRQNVQRVEVSCQRMLTWSLFDRTIELKEGRWNGSLARILLSALHAYTTARGSCALSCGVKMETSPLLTPLTTMQRRLLTPLTTMQRRSPSSPSSPNTSTLESKKKANMWCVSR